MLRVASGSKSVGARVVGAGVFACALVMLCVMLGGTLGGCGLTAPRLTVTDVHAAEVEPTGKVIMIVVEAQNLSNDALPLRDATYSLSLNGRRVFTGKRSPESTLRMFGAQKISLPVALPREGVPPAGIAKYEVSGSVVYLPPGRFNEILYEYGLLRPTTSFRGTGEIDLSALPPMIPAVVVPAAPAPEPVPVPASNPSNEPMPAATPSAG